MKIKTVFLATCLVIAAIACKKEEKEPEKKVSALVGSWQRTKLESRTDTSDWKVNNTPCQLDDVEEYAESGVWTFYSGANQCTPGSGVLKGTWKEVASGTKIVYTYEGSSEEYESTIEKLEGSTMILVHSTGSTDGTMIRTTYAKK